MLSLSLLVAAIFPFLSLALPSYNAPSPPPLHRPRIVTYYPDWAPPKWIDYSLFDVIIFAFALPDKNLQLTWDTDQAPKLLANLVPHAHASLTKVVLSVGGWTGSRYFSDAVATAPSRDTFANNIFDVYNHYGLDGIDIDWEYPGQVGQKGNTDRASDSKNMLEFLEVLRQKLPHDALISAAVQDSTFVGTDGRPMRDVSAFSKLVDWITLMNYDTYGTRQPPGPNAPLSDVCSNSSQPSQNAVGGYNAWTSAGFPSSKILLGAPAYGYIVESDVRRLSARKSFRAYAEDGSGQIQFQSLINQGILTQYPNGSFRAVASSGFTREWDECSDTPYLHSSSAGQIISYDDIESLGIKAAWVKKMNMGGVNLFDIHGDTPRYHLTHALRDNLFDVASSSPNTISESMSTVANVDPVSTSTFQSSPAPSPALSSDVLPIPPRK